MNRTYIDIHTHILPGVDDGSPDCKTSIKMLEDAWANGTGAVILTPHYKQRYRCGSSAEIRKRFDEFKDYAAGKVPVALYLGTEAMYEMDLPQKLSDGEVLTMADTMLVLIEFLPGVNFEYLCNGVFEMTQYGFTPIIAHIERYSCLTPKRVAELRNMGAKIQVNARSVLGKSGFKLKRFCQSVLRSDLVDFIASDAHDPSARSTQLKPCAKHIEARYGKPVSDLLMTDLAKESLSLNF